MSGHNPYEAPRANLDANVGAPAPDQLQTAGRGARFLNLIIDSILSRVVAILFAGVLIRVLGPGDSAQVVVVVVFLAAFFGYYVVLEAAFGWTVAKLITGTRVVRYDGAKPSVAQVLGRTFARLIPFEPFSVLFSDSKQGWHDSLPNTRVVRVRR